MGRADSPCNVEPSRSCLPRQVPASVAPAMTSDNDNGEIHGEPVGRTGCRRCSPTFSSPLSLHGVKSPGGISRHTNHLRGAKRIFYNFLSLALRCILYLQVQNAVYSYTTQLCSYRMHSIAREFTKW